MLRVSAFARTQSVGTSKALANICASARSRTENTVRIEATPFRRLLRSRHHRPRRRAPDPRNELPPSHRAPSALLFFRRPYRLNGTGRGGTGCQLPGPLRLWQSAACDHRSVQNGQLASRRMRRTVDEIEAFRQLGRPNRGVYPSGPLAGQPLPPHPLRFIDLPPAAADTPG
jgi:hypothetical protein